jgi:hypothetical protein
VDRADWDSYPSRVERNTDVLLDLLARHGAHGTFFTLGWVARRFPPAGAADFRSRSRSRLARLLASPGSDDDSGTVSGGRAGGEAHTGGCLAAKPSSAFGLRPSRFFRGWNGLSMSCWRKATVTTPACFPIWRPGGYGYARAAMVPHVIVRDAGSLLELPMTVTHVLGLRTPAAGGGYLRQFPFGVIRRAFRDYAERGATATFYVHPWEVDVDQPRLEVGLAHPATSLRRVGSHSPPARTPAAGIPLDQRSQTLRRPASDGGFSPTSRPERQRVTVRVEPFQGSSAEWDRGGTRLSRLDSLPSLRLAPNFRRRLWARVHLSRGAE